MVSPKFRLLGETPFHSHPKTAGPRACLATRERLGNMQLELGEFTGMCRGTTPSSGSSREQLFRTSLEPKRATAGPEVMFHK